jgi:hypothetical protein
LTAAATVAPATTIALSSAVAAVASGAVSAVCRSGLFEGLIGGLRTLIAALRLRGL